MGIVLGFLTPGTLISVITVPQAGESLTDITLVRHQPIRPLRDTHPALDQPMQDTISGAGSAASEDA